MADSEYDMATILRAHLAGDSGAFDRLLADFRGDLWGFLVNRVKTHQDAEDLYQDICMKVHQNLHKLQEPEKFRSWLFSIALNSVRSFFRKKPRFSLVDSEEALENERVQDPDARQTMEQKEHLLLLRRCIHDLPERDREVLLLNTMAEMPLQEVADHLEMNLNTVKTILRRTKIKLARMMAEVAHG